MEELSKGPAYGYELLERVGRELGPEAKVTPSTLYPTLARLRAAGLVRTFHGTVSAGPLRKYYELTSLGRENLEEMQSIWAEMARWRPDPRPLGGRPGGLDA